MEKKNNYIILTYMQPNLTWYSNLCWWDSILQQLYRAIDLREYIINTNFNNFDIFNRDDMILLQRIFKIMKYNEAKKITKIILAENTYGDFAYKLTNIPKGSFYSTDQVYPIIEKRLIFNGYHDLGVIDKYFDSFGFEIQNQKLETIDGWVKFDINKFNISMNNLLKFENNEINLDKTELFKIIDVSQKNYSRVKSLKNLNNYIFLYIRQLKILNLLEMQILMKCIRYKDYKFNKKKYIFIKYDFSIINEYFNNFDNMDKILYNNRFNYKLISFSINRSHITAYIKDIENDNWYHYDDMSNTIDKVNIKEIFNQIYGYIKIQPANNIFACYELQDKKNNKIIDLICDIINN
jgi:hypothetical protein